MDQDRGLPIPTLYEIEQLSDVLARGKYHARLSFGDIVHVKLQMPVTVNSRRRVGQDDGQWSVSFGYPAAAYEHPGRGS